MFLKAILLTLFAFSLRISAQVAECPASFPEECTCHNTPAGPFVRCITIPLESWNIQATFDEISETINDNSTVVAKIRFDTALLGQQQEVPAHSVSALKTTTLRIYADSKLTRIDPDAFSGSHGTVLSLTIYQMNFLDSQEAFDLINNFKVVQFVELWNGTTLSSVPAHALLEDLQELKSVYLHEVGLTSIGNNAFSGPANLNLVNLAGNNFTLDGISDTAFLFAGQGILLILERNSGITHLPESKFGTFLYGNNNALVVGPGENGDSIYHLHCDERMDWFCDTQITSVYGYLCKEEEYVDIFNYCEQKFGYNPIDKKSFQDLKRFKTEANFRFEKDHIQKKYLRNAD